MTGKDTPYTPFIENVEAQDDEDANKKELPSWCNLIIKWFQNNFWDWAVSRITWETFPWVICSLLSTIYFYLYLLADHDISEDNEYYLQGFCVTGLDISNSTSPTCTPQLGNSHQFAFTFDVMFLILAIALPFTGLCVSPPSRDLCMQGVLFAFVIGFHGILHLAFSAAHCDLGGTSSLLASQSFFGTPNETIISIILYFLFVFLLMAMTIFGFSWLPDVSKPLAFGVSLVLTVIIGAISIQKQGVTVFFMLSHFVVSYVGWLIPNTNKVTVPLGYSFIPPIIISLLEFGACDNILLAMGGHQWYDVTLHASMLVSLATMIL